MVARLDFWSVWRKIRNRLTKVEAGLPLVSWEKSRRTNLDSDLSVKENIDISMDDTLAVYVPVLYMS